MSEDVSVEFVSIQKIDDLFINNQNTNRNESSKKENVLEMGIEELDLAVRSYNSLKRAGIYTIGDLVAKTEKELREVKYMHEKCVEDIQYHLEQLGLTLCSSKES